MQDKPLMHGDRVMVYDWRLFKDDKQTPARMITLPATIVCRYGCRFKKSLPAYNDYGDVVGDSGCDWKYEDLCDVIFDHRPGEVSKGHFTRGVKRIEKGNASSAIKNS